MTYLSRLLAVVALWAAMAVSAWSYPTLFGDTGLVLVPSADVMPYTYFQLGADYSRITSDDGNSTIYPIRLNYGVSENIELFVLFAESVSDSLAARDALGVGFKFGLVNENCGQWAPGVAFGVRAVKLKCPDKDAELIEPYLAASKILLSRGDLVDEGYFVRLHGGVSYANYSGDVDEDSFFTPFVGVSYVNAGGSSLVVDYLPEHEGFREETLSAAVRLRLSQNFWMQLGTTRPLGLGEDQSFTAGIMYQYGEPSVLSRERRIFYY